MVGIDNIVKSDTTSTFFTSVLLSYFLTYYINLRISCFLSTIRSVSFLFPKAKNPVTQVM